MSPDFKSFTDEEVKASYTLIQRLCYAYVTDKEVTKTLHKMHKDLLTDRSSRKITESAEHRNICGREMTSKTDEDVVKKVFRPKIFIRK